MFPRWLALILTLLVHPAFALESEVVFNEPGFRGQPSMTVEDKYISLIDQAASGSEIRFTMYQFTRTPVADALIRASHRGVDVRLVLDGSNYFDHTQPGNAVTALLVGGALRCEVKPCIRFCSGPVHVKLKGQTFGTGCNGLIINHNKFVLFSKLSDGSQNVVVQSSANLADDDLHHYQDLLVIRNDRALYEGYVDYWEMLNRDRTRLTPHKDVRGDGQVKASFFPRIVNKDPVMKLLRRVSCEVPGSTIRLAQADFSRLNIASRLRDLIRQGCDVKVLTRIEPDLFSPAVGVATRLGSNVLILPYKGKDPEYQAANSIHTKLILIDASVDHSPSRRTIVATGSHNLDFFSLHTNDETLLEVEDKPVYDEYIAFWNRLNEAARSSGLHLLQGKDRKGVHGSARTSDDSSAASSDSLLR